MAILEDLFKRRDERHELIQLYHQQNYIEEIFKNGPWKLKDTDPEAYRKAEASHNFEYDTIQASIDMIETRYALQRAMDWRVPIPRQPNEPDNDNRYWEWASITEMYYLSEEGKAHLRREVATEIELRYKPYLSWGAFAISVLSLVISLLKS